MFCWQPQFSCISDVTSFSVSPSYIRDNYSFCCDHHRLVLSVFELHKNGVSEGILCLLLLSGSIVFWGLICFCICCSSGCVWSLMGHRSVNMPHFVGSPTDAVLGIMTSFVQVRYTFPFLWGKKSRSGIAEYRVYDAS